MTFIWPDMLWLLLAVPALVAGYVVLVRRRKKAALRYASLSLVREALGPGQSWRRHLPPLLFLLALVAMLLAVARPSAVVTLPSHHDTVILAMDVSGSMRATDVLPNRLVAAQAAARAFVAEQPRRTRIGVVAFAGTAAVVQAPTSNREEILAAIDRFQVQRGDRHRQRDPGLAEDHLPGRRVRPPLVGPAARRRAAGRPARLGERAQPAGRSSRCRRAPTSPPSSSS